ncbi:MAG: hypothetical protein IJA15_02785 [Clostridia bacterium]|nr:hypothetical protein [Clostridia bacterium]
MEIKRLDATPFLLEGERVEVKITTKKSNFNFIQTIICYATWLLTLLGDVFLLGMTKTLSESLQNVTTFLLPILIVLLVVHFVPFGFWLVFILQGKQKQNEKWYAVTNKRIFVIEGDSIKNVTFINLNDVTSFKTGKDSVNLAVGKEYITLGGIEKPELIAEKLAKVFNDNNNEEDSLPVPEEVETADKTAFISNAEENQALAEADVAEETSSEEEIAQPLDEECEESDDKDGE